MGNYIQYLGINHNGKGYEKEEEERKALAVRILRPSPCP